jgi:hypothetical protein
MGHVFLKKRVLKTRTLMKRFIIGVVIFLSFSFGCAGLYSTPKVATTCTPSQTWDVALASVGEFELRRVNKDEQIIETEWVKDSPPNGGRSGIFQRELNEERARFIITIEPDQKGSLFTVKQVREFWSPQGVQMRSWRQIPPNAEQEHQLATRIETRLKRQAC